MSVRRLSVDADCKDRFTCPSVWQDDEDPECVVVVGHPAPAGTVPVCAGEIAVRVKRQVIVDAGVR